MAATSINASSTAANTSADITVTAGVPATISLRGTIAEESSAVVQIKDSDGSYSTVGQLDRNRRALVIDGPGVYRVSKGAAAAAFGVDQS